MSFHYFPEVSFGPKYKNEWMNIELIWVRKTFYQSFILTTWSTIHHESFRGFFWQWLSIFSLKYLFSYFEWQTRLLISYLTFGQNIYKIFLMEKCSHWRKMCNIFIFHLVLEFQVKHSNKDPILTAHRNWTSILYTSDTKYITAYNYSKKKSF